jgi:hypothetical protein
LKFSLKWKISDKTKMGDGPTTKGVYFRVCAETKREPDEDILAVLNHAIDKQIL